MNKQIQPKENSDIEIIDQLPDRFVDDTFVAACPHCHNRIHTDDLNKLYARMLSVYKPTP